jgi:hypothetical protein
VRLDARLELVKHRPDREVAFEVLERLLDRDQQQVVAPQLGGVLLDKIGDEAARHRDRGDVVDVADRGYKAPD